MALLKQAEVFHFLAAKRMLCGSTRTSCKSTFQLCVLQSAGPLELVSHYFTEDYSIHS